MGLLLSMTGDSLGGPGFPLIQRLIWGDGPASPLRVLLVGVVLVAAVFLPMVSVLAMVGIWGERKVAGHIQSRIGPNRVGGYFGWAQSLADGIKLVLKEDLIPAEADRILFRIAPYLAFAPVFGAFVALPFGPELAFEPRLNAGVFFILAVLSVEVMGIILAGWASNNKWSVYGAMREACQMVSYEIPLGLSIIVAVMTAGTLNLAELGFRQSGGLHTWLVFANPFVCAAFFIYFVASLASNKRAPFDLPESESELVAGFHIEYSGMRFAFFFFAEYAAMFIVASIQTALFLGGWNDPFGVLGKLHHDALLAQDAHKLIAINLIGAGIFMSKAGLIVFAQMWLRWTLPRPRIDQVLYTCVKVLLPMACVTLLGGALWQLFIPDRGGAPWRDFNPWSWTAWLQSGGSAGAIIGRVVLALCGAAGFSAIVGWVGYSFVTGRRIRQRLTDPAAIITDRDRIIAAR